MQNNSKTGKREDKEMKERQTDDSRVKKKNLWGSEVNWLLNLPPKVLDGCIVTHSSISYTE